MKHGFTCMKSLLTNISLKWRRWTSCFIPHLVFGIYFLETFYHDLWKLQRTKIETIILSSFWSQYNYNLFPSRVCRLPTEVWLVWARKSYKLYLYLNKIFCINRWKNEKNEWKEWKKVWHNYSRQSNYYDQIVESHIVSIATVEHLKKIPQNRIL